MFFCEHVSFLYVLNYINLTQTQRDMKYVRKAKKIQKICFSVMLF